MNPVVIENVVKSFGDTRAVDGVSFEVKKGEIFGLLGPNGAGKTTTIRLMLDIFKPESGSVSILGGEMSPAKQERIGYMPEERGLYQDISLDKCLIYLATLKGLSTDEARTRAENYLERFNLFEHRQKKVKELSKGMQQKAQIINTIIHEPELIIIDEPFTALDPVNTQMVKDLMREMRDAGTSIIMSTHQMHQVEELCDRILLVDEGKNVLYGNLQEIQQRFMGDELIVQINGTLPELAGVDRVEQFNHSYKLHLAEGTEPQKVLQQLVSNGTMVNKFEIAVPGLDEIFIRVV